MDKQLVSNQIGYLIMRDDGAVLESGGDLKNDEHSANIIMDLLNLTESIDENFIPNNSCERISLDYETHSYNICMSNRRIYVVKLRKINGIQEINGSTTANLTATSSNNTLATTVNTTSLYHGADEINEQTVLA